MEEERPRRGTGTPQLWLRPPLDAALTVRLTPMHARTLARPRPAWKKDDRPVRPPARFDAGSNRREPSLHRQTSLEEAGRSDT